MITDQEVGNYELDLQQWAGLVVGQTPWSARVPLDPLLASEISFLQTQQADEGVGCGPGGPPHYHFRWFGPAKTNRHSGC